MSKTQNILFVLEGRDAEKTLVKRLTEVFNFSGTSYTVNGNIYALYQAVKDDPYVNIVDVLKVMQNSESDKSVLSRVFTDVFLVFDSDLHHTQHPQDAHTLSQTEIVKRNMKIVVEMVSRFNESTDPSRGKLLINYPMVESFRDCDAFFDESYANARVDVRDLARYKNIVGHRRLASRHVKNYTRENFCNLIKMNILKLNQIVRGEFTSPTYDVFWEDSSQDVIARKETESIERHNCIEVLNTLLFLPLDYFGNKNNLFDEIVNG